MPSLLKPVTIAATCMFVFLSGCSTHQSKPGKTGYLKQTEQMSTSKNLPFHREWYDSEVNWNSFKKVYIAPVDTSHLEHASWWQKMSLNRNLDKGRNEVGNNMHKQFVHAFSKGSKGRFVVVDKPGPDVLTIETALTELVPTKAWLNTLEAVTIFVPFSKGLTAMESRMIDGSTGKIIATVADTKQGRISVFSGADFTWWSHARNAIDSWALDFEKVVATGWQGRVKARSEFALVTW